MATQKKEDELNMKLSILKKGLLEERNKTKKLQEENDNLKENLLIQKEIVMKLQAEISNLREKSGEKQISTFINILFDKDKDEIDEEKIEDKIEMLNREINDLKNKNSDILKQKDFINSKLNEQIKNYEELKKTSKMKFEEMQTYYENQEQFNDDECTRIKSLTELIRKLEIEKYDFEKIIHTYEQDKQAKQKEKDILIKQQKVLHDLIDVMNKETFELKHENKILNEKLEDLAPITKKTIFKGLRIISRKPKKTAKIEMSFGKIENNLVITEEENQNGRVINLNHIHELKKVNNNKIEFITLVSDIKECYLIRFKPQYIAPIIQFFKELSDKN